MRDSCRAFVDDAVTPFIRSNWQREWDMSPGERLPRSILKGAETIGIRTIDVALYQGEACTSTSRILVHDALHDEFLERFARATEKLVVGDGLDPATDIGAMVDAKHRDKVLAYLDIALKEGARLVTQGKLPTEERLKGGYWVAPTVLADVTPDLRAKRCSARSPASCGFLPRKKQSASPMTASTA